MMQTGHLPGVLSQYCIARCTSHACDAMGDCAALRFQRRERAKTDLGRLVALLRRTGPLTVPEIVRYLWADDVPNLQRLPDWQRGYLDRAWEQALIPWLQRHSEVFRAEPGSPARWGVVAGPELVTSLARAEIRLPATAPYAAALEKLRPASRPVSLPRLLEACAITAASPDYGRRLADLAKVLQSTPWARCVYVEPRSGLPWRWLPVDRVVHPALDLSRFPSVSPPLDLEDAPFSGIAVRIDITDFNLIWGVIFASSSLRALLPRTPTPAAVEWISPTTSDRYVIWYEPERGVLYGLEEFFLLEAIEIGTRLRIEPVETPGVYAIVREAVDPSLPERRPRTAVSGHGHRPTDHEILIAVVEHLESEVAAVENSEEEICDRLTRIAAQLESLERRLGGGSRDGS